MEINVQGERADANNHLGRVQIIEACVYGNTMYAADRLLSDVDCFTKVRLKTNCSYANLSHCISKFSP